MCLTGNALGKRKKNGEEGVWYTIKSIGIPANRLLLIWGGRLLKKSLKLNPKIDIMGGRSLELEQRGA